MTDSWLHRDGWSQAHRLGSAAPRIALYSHDTYGLGNIRRTLLIAEMLAGSFPDASILLVTGSAMIQGFRLPPGVDYVKVPCVERTAADHYVPRYLVGCEDRVGRMRRELVTAALTSFRPDLLIVDRRPSGIDGELLPALERLRSRADPARIVLGVRDILDDPVTTRAALARSRAFEIIERYYDEVWVYGSQEVFDAPTEYGFPPSVARKTVFSGYLGRPMSRRPRLEGPPRVLVTVGGGADGRPVVEAYLEGLAGSSRPVDLASRVVLGPEMGGRDRDRLRSRFDRLPGVEIVDFADDCARELARADLVVSMAGYNTTCEVLAASRAAVLVPRATPVREQLIRARRLAGLGCVYMVEPGSLCPEGLMARVLASVHEPPPRMGCVDLAGLGRLDGRVRRLLQRDPATRPCLAPAWAGASGVTRAPGGVGGGGGAGLAP